MIARIERGSVILKTNSILCDHVVISKGSFQKNRWPLLRPSHPLVLFRQQSQLEKDDVTSYLCT